MEAKYSKRVPIVWDESQEPLAIQTQATLRLPAADSKPWNKIVWKEEEEGWGVDEIPLLGVQPISSLSFPALSPFSFQSSSNPFYLQRADFSQWDDFSEISPLPSKQVNPPPKPKSNTPLTIKPSPRNAKMLTPPTARVSPGAQSARDAELQLKKEPAQNVQDATNQPAVSDGQPDARQSDARPSDVQHSDGPSDAGHSDAKHPMTGQQGRGESEDECEECARENATLPQPLLTPSLTTTVPSNLSGLAIPGMPSIGLNPVLSPASQAPSIPSVIQPAPLSSVWANLGGAFGALPKNTGLTGLINPPLLPSIPWTPVTIAPSLPSVPLIVTPPSPPKPIVIPELIFTVPRCKAVHVVEKCLDQMDLQQESTESQDTVNRTRSSEKDKNSTEKAAEAQEPQVRQGVQLTPDTQESRKSEGAPPPSSALTLATEQNLSKSKGMQIRIAAFAIRNSAQDLTQPGFIRSTRGVMEESDAPQIEVIKTPKGGWEKESKKYIDDLFPPQHAADQDMKNSREHSDKVRDNRKPSWVEPSEPLTSTEIADVLGSVLFQFGDTSRICYSMRTKSNSVWGRRSLLYNLPRSVASEISRLKTPPPAHYPLIFHEEGTYVLQLDLTAVSCQFFRRVICACHIAFNQEGKELTPVVRFENGALDSPQVSVDAPAANKDGSRNGVTHTDRGRSTAAPAAGLEAHASTRVRGSAVAVGAASAASTAGAARAGSTTSIAGVRSNTASRTDRGVYVEVALYKCDATDAFRNLDSCSFASQLWFADIWVGHPKSIKDDVQWFGTVTCDTWT